MSRQTPPLEPGQKTGTAVDLAELKRLAQAAQAITPGPWTRFGGDIWAPVDSEGVRRLVASEPPHEATGDLLLAACSPAAIIELVDAADSALSDKVRAAFHCASATHWAKEADAIAAERDALRARVAELEAEVRWHDVTDETRDWLHAEVGCQVERSRGGLWEALRSAHEALKAEILTLAKHSTAYAKGRADERADVALPESTSESTRALTDRPGA